MGQWSVAGHLEPLRMCDPTSYFFSALEDGFSGCGLPDFTQ